MNKKSLILSLLDFKGWGPSKVFSYVKVHNFNYDLCIAALDVILTSNERQQLNALIDEKEKVIEMNEEKEIHSICVLDDGFPSKLYLGPDKCLFLYYKGDISLLNKKAVTIIGTRNPNESFVERGKIVTKLFVEQDCIIISGLALGCDTVAHQACLDAGGKTIAVLPSACDNIQPPRNKELANRIVENGGLLISEYGTESKYSVYNYPQRDRIQSSLSNVIVIIQASDDSGTMIAARKSLKDGKKVVALKGNNLKLVEEYIDESSKEDIENISIWL